MIEYKDVSLTASNGNTILKHLSFQIREGEFFVLIGPSGSGKTTTLKLINRLMKETSGQILFQGKNIDQMDLRQHRLQTGYVLQQIALFPNMTVAENIALIPELKKMPKQQVEERSRELLEKVGLDPDVYLARLPEDLSGGEKQRIGILRAIIANPKILLMDEPFSALDPLSRSQLQELIAKIQKDLGITTVFVTHDMDEALRLADRICLMKDGQVVQIGTSQELQEHPANDFVQSFLKQGGWHESD